LQCTRTRERTNKCEMIAAHASNCLSDDHKHSVDHSQYLGDLKKQFPSWTAAMMMLTDLYYPSKPTFIGLACPPYKQSPDPLTTLTHLSYHIISSMTMNSTLLILGLSTEHLISTPEWLPTIDTRKCCVRPSGWGDPSSQMRIEFRYWHNKFRIQLSIPRLELADR
jgi:hypothetical protein